MKTSEEILKEIQAAMSLNKSAKAECNTALTDAMSLIIHDMKELQNRLDEEYKRGMNDAWEIAREFCKTDYDERYKIFGDSSVKHVIETYAPLIIKERMVSYREEKEKVRVGDIVKNRLDDTKATVLDIDDFENRIWTVYTENACVDIWCESEFTKTGESVDPCAVLLK